MSSMIVKGDVIQQLQEQVLVMQGLKKNNADYSPEIGLGKIEASFPGGVFPIGAIHEFISRNNEDAAATNGFISGMLGRFMKKNSISLWVSKKRNVNPAALIFFGIKPDSVIFIDLARTKDALWVVEEALKCEAITCVVAELSDLSFVESRRLQLAVEKSRVSGFIHRYQPRNENNLACMTRWKIRTSPSDPGNGMPGVGFPRWNIELIKVRNGIPMSWQVEWSPNGLYFIEESHSTLSLLATSKTG
ncbi:MAG: Error-prone repair protein ImuA [Chitinophagales bacterium]|nr:Error-prone repair protein ImuA [Chitinophagales bacterium]